MEAAIKSNPDHLSSLDTVNPVALGKVPVYHYEHYGSTKAVDGYWGQDDYLRLWMAVICGLEATPQEDEGSINHWQTTHEVIGALFEAHAELAGGLKQAMEDSALPYDQRADAYYKFTEKFIACVNCLHGAGILKVEPVDKLVGLIDYERSLGCRSEFQLAEVLGVRTL